MTQQVLHVRERIL